MKKSSIQNQIKSKLEQDAGGMSYVVPWWCRSVKPMPRGIEIGNQEIRMNYYIEFNTNEFNLLFGNKVTQGSF